MIVLVPSRLSPQPHGLSWSLSSLLLSPSCSQSSMLRQLKYLITKTGAWQESRPSAGRLLVLPEAGRGTWRECIQGLFYLLELAAAVRFCFYLCHLKGGVKGHEHCYQNNAVKIGILYIFQCVQESNISVIWPKKVIWGKILFSALPSV